MKLVMEQSLLDVLYQELCCEYLSDLRFLSASECRKAAELIEEKIPADASSLFEWNDALEYLVGAEPEPVPEVARKRLIGLLNNQEGHIHIYFRQHSGCQGEIKGVPSKMSAFPQRAGNASSGSVCRICERPAQPTKGEYV